MNSEYTRGIIRGLKLASSMSAIVAPKPPEDPSYMYGEPKHRLEARSGAVDDYRMMLDTLAAAMEDNHVAVAPDPTPPDERRAGVPR